MPLITVAPETMAIHPPYYHPQSNLLSCIPYLTSVYFWLVVAFTVILWQPFKAKLYFLFVILFFVVQSITTLNDGTTSPHALLQPPRATSSTSITLNRSSISGWLLCVIIKFWPLKAKERPSLNFKRVLFGTHKQANQPWHHKPQPQLLCMGP